MYKSFHLAEFSFDPVQVCQDANNECVLVMMCLELEFEDIRDLVLLRSRSLLAVDLRDLG